MSARRREAGARAEVPLETSTIGRRPEHGAADAAFADFELRDRLEKAIAQLPENYRLLIAAHYLDGGQYEALAEALDFRSARSRRTCIAPSGGCASCWMAARKRDRNSLNADLLRALELVEPIAAGDVVADAVARAFRDLPAAARRRSRRPGGSNDARRTGGGGRAARFTAGAAALSPRAVAGRAARRPPVQCGDRVGPAARWRWDLGADEFERRDGRGGRRLDGDGHARAAHLPACRADADTYVAGGAPPMSALAMWWWAERTFAIRSRGHRARASRGSPPRSSATPFPSRPESASEAMRARTPAVRDPPAACTAVPADSCNCRRCRSVECLVLAEVIEQLLPSALRALRVERHPLRACAGRHPCRAAYSRRNSSMPGRGRPSRRATKLRAAQLPHEPDLLHHRQHRTHLVLATPGACVWMSANATGASSAPSSVNACRTAEDVVRPGYFPPMKNW